SGTAIAARQKAPPMRSIWYIGPKRVSTRSSSSDCRRTMTSSSDRPSAAPTSAKGRSESGNSPWMALIRRRSMSSGARFAATPRRPAEAAGWASDMGEVHGVEIACAGLLEAPAAEQHRVRMAIQAETRGEIGARGEHLLARAAVDHAEEVV